MDGWKQEIKLDYFLQSKDNLGEISTNSLYDADEIDQLYPMHYMSENVISLHYVPPKKMYLIDYLLYHVKNFK